MHTCHAIACEVEVPPSMLMCKPHWFKVPRDIRIKVWAEYENGISNAYCAVAKAAVIVVAEREGRTVTGDEPEIRLYDLIQTTDSVPDQTHTTGQDHGDS